MTCIWHENRSGICSSHRLYESPKKHVFLERGQSALRWCRHVLDNPSPEIEAACRSLIKKLDQRKKASSTDSRTANICDLKGWGLRFTSCRLSVLSGSSGHFYKRPVFHQTGSSVSMTHNTSDSMGNIIMFFLYKNPWEIINQSKYPIFKFL